MKKVYSIERNYVDFGEYLQEMRLKAGLSQREVADTLGYATAQFISNFERGIATPPLSKLKIMIKMYKMPVDKVMDMILDAERSKMAKALEHKKRA